VEGLVPALVITKGDGKLWLFFSYNLLYKLFHLQINGKAAIKLQVIINPLPLF
jgi:hypothetical protein